VLLHLLPEQALIMAVVAVGPKIMLAPLGLGVTAVAVEAVLGIPRKRKRLQQEQQIPVVGPVEILRQLKPQVEAVALLLSFPQPRLRQRLVRQLLPIQAVSIAINSLGLEQSHSKVEHGTFC
jgi:hypothetical protein